jgi:hypothetical protein
VEIKRGGKREGDGKRDKVRWKREKKRMSE